MGVIACFGELLLRMSPELGGTWIREASMPVYVGGAELNVARALGIWNQSVRYLTALPNNYLSDEITDYLEGLRIDTSHVHRSGNRIGIYYLPQGADLKNAGVLYDRAGSSFATLQRGEIDWNGMLEGADWFHLSAICPAVSASAAEVCLEALEACREKGITVSIDLNYRSRLWQYGKKPTDIMPALLEHCQVVMGNIWSAKELLGIPFDEHIHEYQSRQAYLDQASASAAAIRSRFPSCETMANTFRFDEGSGIRYFASLDTAAAQVFSKDWQLLQVVDRVGSGDCFMAGLIHGLYGKKSLQQVIDFAAAAAVAKLQEKGDATQRSVSFIESTLQVP